MRGFPLILRTYIITAGNSGRREDNTKGERGQRKQNRGREGKRVWRKRQGRQNVSGDGVSGDGRDRKREENKKARVKAEARFMSPRIPTSFYRPWDDWVRLSGCMATEVSLAAARRWAHCSGDSRLKRTISDVWKQVGTCNCISYLAGFGKAFM